MASEAPVGVISRADAVLRAIAASGETGARLKELAERTGIARPSVHRILQELTGVGWVTQRDDRRYALGEGLGLLGLAAPIGLPGLPAVRAVAQALADAVGDTVYVAVREPQGVRYVLRAEGDFPIRSHVVSVGQTKAFTMSYSGLALLATLPEEVREAALSNIVVEAPPGWASTVELADAMHDAVRQVRLRGWCTGSGLVMPGISGIAAPVPHPDATPIAAVSISAIESRLPEARAEAIAPALLQAARRIGRIISPPAPAR